MTMSAPTFSSSGHLLGQRLAEWGRRVFTLDLRSLALLRMGLGLLVLADGLVAFTNAEMLYSDAGILPRNWLYERHWPSVGTWTLHALSGDMGWQLMLIGLQILSGIWLVVGRHTRLATLACWVLYCSLESRNPVITNGADAMTRLLLFWSLFLPLGARWSLDALHRRKEGLGLEGHSSLCSIPTVALMLQVAFIYWFSVLCKTHTCWWGDGTALQQTLQLDLLARPFAVWLRDQALLCRIMTYGWLVLEIVGPILALLPVRRPHLRVVMVLLFMAYHAGIELCLDIGAFPSVMIVAWTAFIPGVVWDKLKARFFRRAADESGGDELAVVPFVRTCFTRVANGFCQACLAFVFMWNLRGTNFTFWERVFPRSINPIAFALRLDQHWSMFSPRPASDDGWFVLRAGLSDGTEVDLLRDGAPADARKPALLSATFKDSRWQKYIMNLWMEEYRHLRPVFGDAMALHWNRHHGGLTQVVAWQLWLMLEPTLPDGSAGPVKPIMLYERERLGPEIGVEPQPGQSEPLRAAVR